MPTRVPAGPPSAPSGSESTSAAANRDRASRSGTRSWGREGPAMHGSTVPRSRSSVSVNVGSAAGSCHSPCSLA